MAEEKKRPGVGIGVVVIKNEKLLMGQRKTHGKDTWSIPGGWLEFGESFEDCAARECLEETGVRIKDVSFMHAVNNILPEDNVHSATLFMKGEYHGGEPIVREPEKFINVGWYDLKNLPQPLFNPLRIFIASHPHLFR